MSDSLGSLSQTARSSKLKSARIVMFVVGVLTIGANAFFFFRAEKEVDKAIEKELAGMVVQDQAELAELRATAIRLTKLGSGVGIGLGVIFCVLGALVIQKPIPCTVLALVLYVGAALVVGVMDPSTFARGLILKIIIIVLLAQAIQSAFAYEKERERELTAPPPDAGEGEFSNW